MSRLSRYRPALGAVLLVAYSGLSQGEEILDRVVLINGSTILGHVTDIKNGKVSVKTEFAGTLKISIEQIKTLDTSNPVVVKLSDGSITDNVLIHLEDGKPSLQKVDSENVSQAIELDTIDVINPEPWQIGLAYKHEGGASLALVQQRGNSDTDQLDYRIDAKWTGDDDRFNLLAEGELDESEGRKNAENWTVSLKYDRFTDTTAYYGVNSSVKQDEFADLDLRFYVGPYYGQQFFDTDQFTLSAELGLTYVRENFIQADDQSYPGANWTLDIGSDWLGNDTQLYLKQQGIWDLDNLDDLIIDTRIGLTIPLLMNVQAAAEYSLEYDSGAPEGIDEIDQSIKVRFGYRW